MKKSFYIIMMVSVLALTFGCKKEEAESAKASFSAKVEGTLWTGATLIAQHSTGGNMTTITASGSMPSEQIVMYIKGSGTGTFTLNDDNLASVVVGNYIFSSLFSDNPNGTIVITKYDEANKKISGTFNFTGEDINGIVYHVTEGKFENVDLVIM